MAKMIKLIAVLLILIVSGNTSYSEEKQDIVVYIDPAATEKDSAQFSINKGESKDTLLVLGKRLKELLISSGNTSYLSRENNIVLGLDERLNQAKRVGCGVYLYLKISQSVKDCISIYIPGKEKREAQGRKKDVEADTIFTDLEYADRREESLNLASSISAKIKELSNLNCVKVGSKPLDIFEKSSCPIVVIDFGVSKSALPYIYDNTRMNQILSAISKGIAARKL